MVEKAIGVMIGSEIAEIAELDGVLRNHTIMAGAPRCTFRYTYEINSAKP